MAETSEPIGDSHTPEVPTRPSERELNMIVAGIVENAAKKAELNFRQSLSEKSRAAVEEIRARNERMRKLGSDWVAPERPITARIHIRPVLQELEHDLTNLAILHQGVVAQDPQSLRQIREDYLGFSAEDLEALYAKLALEVDKLKVAVTLGGAASVDQANSMYD